MSDISPPKGEIVWVGYYNVKNELMFIITSKPARDCYYLYEISDGKQRKLGKSKSPTELEDKFDVKRKVNS